MKKIIKSVADVLIVALFFLAVITLIAALKQRESGVPGAFGCSIASVQTNSMSGTIEPGDLVIGKLVNADTKIRKGDIVSYRKLVDRQYVTITHRVSDVVMIDGIPYYQTWGDNRSADYEGEPDVCPAADEGYRSRGDIVSVHCFTLRGMGKVLDFLKTPAGFILCLAMPLLAYIVYEVAVLIRIVAEHRKEELLQETREASENMRDAIIREYLEKQAAENAGSNPAAAR